MRNWHRVDCSPARSCFRACRRWRRRHAARAVASKLRARVSRSALRTDPTRRSCGRRTLRSGTRASNRARTVRALPILVRRPCCDHLFRPDSQSGVTPPFIVSMLWHPRFHADPAHRWLRDLVADCCVVSGCSPHASRSGEPGTVRPSTSTPGVPRSNTVHVVRVPQFGVISYHCDGKPLRNSLGSGPHVHATIFQAIRHAHCRSHHAYPPRRSSGRQRLSAVAVVAGFQVSTGGRTWVSAEGSESQVGPTRSSGSGRAAVRHILPAMSWQVRSRRSRRKTGASWGGGGGAQ